MAPTAPTTRRMVGRALLRHCPVCGSGHLFPRWFSMVDRCPRCGLRFERIEGHWTGDLGINTIVSFGALLVTLLVGTFATYPDVPGVALFVAAVLVAALTPVLFFPFSKTLWLVIDLAMRPLEPGEVRPGFGPPASPAPDRRRPEPEAPRGREPCRSDDSCR